MQEGLSPVACWRGRRSARRPRRTAKPKSAPSASAASERRRRRRPAAAAGGRRAWARVCASTRTLATRRGGRGMTARAPAPQTTGTAQAGISARASRRGARATAQAWSMSLSAGGGQGQGFMRAAEGTPRGAGGLDMTASALIAGEREAQGPTGAPARTLRRGKGSGGTTGQARRGGTSGGAAGARAGGDAQDAPLQLGLGRLSWGVLVIVQAGWRVRCCLGVQSDAVLATSQRPVLALLSASTGSAAWKSFCTKLLHAATFYIPWSTLHCLTLAHGAGTRCLFQ